MGCVLRRPKKQFQDIGRTLRMGGSFRLLNKRIDANCFTLKLDQIAKHYTTMLYTSITIHYFDGNVFRVNHFLLATPT
jgi:hypothetical protein